MGNNVHVPMRMCAVTREKLPKKELIRFVKTQTDGIILDRGQRVRGRGLNIKPTLEVYDLAITKKVFNRAFGVNITNEQIETLRGELEKYLEQRNNVVKVVRISKESLDNLKK